MAGMKFMSVWMMPIMMFFICNNLSAALSYYYLLSNIITMIMTWYIRKYVVTEDKVRAEMMINAKKPKKKSAWQQRLEEAQKMQAIMQKLQIATMAVSVATQLYQALQKKGIVQKIVPRNCAQRPLPSIIMAMCCGTLSLSIISI